MTLKNRLAKLEKHNSPTKRKPVYIFFHGVNADGSEPELLGYETTSHDRIMRLAGESVHDFQCRCKEVIPIPSGSNAVVLMGVYA